MSLQDRLDLKKRFPGYFHRWVFRGAFLLMALLFVASIFLVGSRALKPYVYVECPDTGVDCINPFYACQNNFLAATFDGADCSGVDDTCARFPYLCESEFWPSGSVIGERPPALLGWLPPLFFLIMFGAFALNHYYYWRKKTL